MAYRKNVAKRKPENCCETGVEIFVNTKSESLQADGERLFEEITRKLLIRY